MTITPTTMKMATFRGKRRSCFKNQKFRKKELTITFSIFIPISLMLNSEQIFTDSEQ